VIEECAVIFGGGAIALVYGPTDCVFGRIGEDGALAFSPGRPWPAGEPMYEVHIFSQSAELRWLHRAGGKGQGAVLTEESALLDRLDRLTDWTRGDPVVSTVPEGGDIRYLLWGTGTGDSVGKGWSRLAERRIGAMDVPIADIGMHSHAFLVAREYVVADPHNDGNVEVAEERLLQLTADEVSHE